MSTWRKLYLTVLAVGLYTIGMAQQNCVEPNPSAHIVLIPAGLPKLDGQALPKGSIISLVFESGDSLRCAGQIVWQEKSAILQAYGATPEGDPGYKANEALKFRIILPNGCRIEDDLITSKFQGIDNNQNPSFQNLAIDRLEQLEAVSPQFNFTLPASDSIDCNQTQIEINPQVDVIGAVFQWSTDSLGVISTRSKLSVEVAGTYHLTVAYGGCKKSQSIEIKDVRLIPEITFNPVSPQICQGETARIEVSTNVKTASFLWNNGAKANVIMVTKEGRYTVVVNTPSGCSNEKGLDLIVNPKPALELGDTKEVCKGDSLRLEVPSNENFSYTWNTGASSHFITVKQSGRYKLQIKDSNNCSNTDSVQVNFVDPPQMNLPARSDLCIGDSLVLKANSNATLFRWSTGQTTSNITVYKSGIYQLQASSNAGCRVSASVEVSLVPPPSSSLASAINRCAGETVVLNPNATAVTYRWSSGETSATLSPQKSGLYIVTITNSAGCSSTDSTRVDFLPAPLVELGQNRSLCNGQIAKLSVVDSTGYRYRWSTEEKLPSIETVKSGLYIVTVSNIANCQSIDSIRVIFNATPQRVLPKVITDCEKDTKKIVAGINEYKYQWSTGEATASIIPKKSGLYTVTISTVEGCTTLDSSTIVLTTNPQVKLSTHDTICPGENLVLDVRSLGQSFAWSTGATSGLITVSSSGFYEVTVTDKNGCSGQGSSRVALINLPLAQIEGSKNFICLGDSLTLNGKGGVPLRWIATGNSSQMLSSTQLRVFPKTQSTYTYVVENHCGTDTASVQIGVHQVNGNAGKDTAILAGRKLKLQATGGKNYQWTTPEFDISDTNSPTPEVAPQDSTYFVVAIKDANNCVLMDTVFVGVYSSIAELVKPINLFTPNGDGKNDALKFNDLNLFLKNQLTVFNRWGGVVYKQANYQNDWDGTYQGQLLPAGVYYYTLELDEAVLKSSLTLIRN